MLNKTFIFQTGHGKGLAKAEIEALLGKESVIDEVFDGLVVETEEKLATTEEARKLLDRMGGVVRITEVLKKGPAEMPLNFSDWIEDALMDRFKNKKGKFRYGLSMHPKAEKILKKILIFSKKKLKNSLGNLRFVNKDFQNLSSVQAWHEGLLTENACELHLFQSKKYWYLTQTLAIQNFEWYSKRDYERPARDPKVGMFPPKLAQILINIAVEKNPPSPDLTIFDPFCGSGTVLQEAWLMGFSAQGSDIDSKLVRDSVENLSWLKTVVKHSSIFLPEKTPQVQVIDATKLSEKDLPESEFVLVSETTLGPALTRPPSDQERKKIQDEIENLYENFFDNLKKITQKPITLVFTAPFHKEKNDRHFLPNLPEILNRHTEVIPLSDHARPSLFYERKNQIVGREIWKVLIRPTA